MFRVFARIIADALVIATTLFVAAGTLAWQRAWILLAVLVVVRALSAIAIFRVNPALLAERATVLIHRDQPWIDKLVLFAFMGTAFVAVPVIDSLDVFGWHVLPIPSVPVASIGLLLFTFGWILIAIALRTNAFAATVVRLQHERQHTVVDSGIYGFIRHPMYAGNPLVNVGLSVWLGSYAAALFAVVPLALLIVRIGLEERFLRRELPGYHEYTTRVPYRLIPRLW
ncbi:MAG TPA: isoprenylcysteine carboxylmethyltransferase family protein [Gemmatimonadaceae bacterium]|nr:isoprenylcysteine carboxylmethyltransferase family protein [Gemmatimonadaceae bacterium]